MDQQFARRIDMKKKIVFYILMFLPLTAVLIALPFLPEQIPAHYGFDGQVTRWGSKYETLIFPAMTVLLGAIMLALAKFSSKQEETGSNNEKVCLAIGIASLALFNAMTAYFLYTDFQAVDDLSSTVLDVNQLIFGLLGISMVVLGNIMPKLRMNSAAGLRTVWSMKNDITWKKSQRFGGISFIAGGTVIVVVCFFAKGAACFLWAMAILAVLVAVDVSYTYALSKKY